MTRRLKHFWIDVQIDWLRVLVRVSGLLSYVRHDWGARLRGHCCREMDRIEVEIKKLEGRK